MTEFHHPYQFIRVDTRKTKTDEWKTLDGLERVENRFIRHDYWHKDGLSGRITCTLKTLSPLVVGGEQQAGNKDKKTPGSVTPYRDRDGNPAIPGNSLRGMIGNIAETISQSSLRVLIQAENGEYSVRKPATEALTLKGTVCQQRSHIQPEGGDTPIALKIEALAALEAMMRSLVERENNQEDKKNKRRAILRGNCDSTERGWESGDGKPLVLDDDHLFYRVAEGNAVEISYSSIWRKAIPGNLYEAFKKTGGSNSLPWNADRDALTPAEALFGVVEDKPDEKKRGGARNLASRVRFTDAIVTQPIELQDPVILKILNSPKPPSPALYFSGQGRYVAKTELDLRSHTPNGRKHYLPHPRSLFELPRNDWETQRQNYHPHMHLRCQPIPAQVEFRFYIHFENLSEAELGLLLTALQPAKTGDTFVHRLGLGKPLGLGHVQLEAYVETINRQQRYSRLGLQAERYQAWSKQPDISLVNTKALEELRWLANPNNVPANIPVCYPFDSNKGQQAYSEGEGFKWFSKNDSRNRQAIHQVLESVKPGKPLPTLKS